MPPNPLPPELARLGEQLQAATARAVARRRSQARLRRRAALVAAVGALALAGILPAVIGTSQTGRSLTAVSTTVSSTAVAHPPCDTLRAATLTVPEACAPAVTHGTTARGVLQQPVAWN
jgi:hypothetical protein